jgi:hypothetical protein
MDAVDAEHGWPRRGPTDTPDFVAARPPQSVRFPNRHPTLPPPTIQDTTPKRVYNRPNPESEEPSAEEVRDYVAAILFSLSAATSVTTEYSFFTCLQRFMSIICCMSGTGNNCNF